MSKAYVVGSYAFVKGATRGCWIRSHVCVAYVDCPHCRVPAGKPCLGVHGPTADTHTMRRDDYAKLVRMRRHRAPDAFTAAEAVQMARNIGIDTGCAACMETFFSGGTSYAHTCAPSDSVSTLVEAKED